MDTFEVITNLLGNVAFPIVISLYLLYMNDTQDKRHQQEVDQLSKAIENNTLVMTRLVDKMEDK